MNKILCLVYIVAFVLVRSDKKNLILMCSFEVSFNDKVKIKIQEEKKWYSFLTSCVSQMTGGLQEYSVLNAT